MVKMLTNHPLTPPAKASTDSAFKGRGFPPRRRVATSQSRLSPRRATNFSTPNIYFCTGGTYSLGTAEPSPKKNWSICLTMTS
jgi:hypothetical protein